MKHPRIWLLPALLTLVAMTISAPPAGARDAQPDGPTYGAPTVGACSAMTYRQFYAKADLSKVVDCSHTHTAKVAGVVQMPSSLSYDDSVDALYKVIAKKCLPQIHALLGRTDAVRDSSAYSLAFFQPTKTQINHGARWLSCSVIMLRTTSRGSALVPLPTNKEPMLPSGKLKDSIARCLRQISSGAWVTPCSTVHQWRATGTFTKAGKFPGTKAINKLGERKCRSRTHSRTYSWKSRGRVDWNVGGDHTVVCYTKTTH